MTIALGADHAGFALKQRLRSKLERDGHQVIDYGTTSEESSDYPDFASSAARGVAQGTSDRGILVCATGIGMSIAANKVPGVRAALASSVELARLARAHNDANVLTLGGKFVDPAEAERIVDTFLSTDFDGGRHARRVAKIGQLEQKQG